MKARPRTIKDICPAVSMGLCTRAGCSECVVHSGAEACECYAYRASCRARSSSENFGFLMGIVFSLLAFLVYAACERTM